MRTRSRAVVVMLVLIMTLALPGALIIAVQMQGTHRTAAARECPAGFRVTLPSDGWRLDDGSFVLARRAVPGPNGTRLFNDNAGRARCFRPID